MTHSTNTIIWKYFFLFFWVTRTIAICRNTQTYISFFSSFLISLRSRFVPFKRYHGISYKCWSTIFKSLEFFCYWIVSGNENCWKIQTRKLIFPFLENNWRQNWKCHHFTSFDSICCDLGNVWCQWWNQTRNDGWFEVSIWLFQRFNCQKFRILHWECEKHKRIKNR